MFQVSKIPKQPTRKVTLDVAVSNTSKWACEATCRKCQKQGYYQSVCRSVINLATTQTDTVNQKHFIGTIEIISTYSKDNHWMIELLLQGKPFQFTGESEAI